MLSRLVITFLPRSKRLLISWLQSPSVVILEPREIKSDTVRVIFVVAKRVLTKNSQRDIHSPILQKVEYQMQFE